MNNNDRRCCAAPLEDGSCCGLPDRHDGEHYSTNEMMKDFVNPSRHEVVRLTAERDAALAACAEMRAALEVGLRGSFEPDTDGTKLCRFCSGFVSREEQARDIVHDVGCFVERARALLSRPDLGAGVAVVPREMVERVRDEALQSIATIMVFINDSPLIERLRAVVADLDALLKKVGG